MLILYTCIVSIYFFICVVFVCVNFKIIFYTNVNFFLKNIINFIYINVNKFFFLKM
jgi:hypothetical protein